MLPQRGVLAEAETVEITLGRMVLQSRCGHEEANGGEPSLHGAVQGFGHKSLVVHLGIAHGGNFPTETTLLFAYHIDETPGGSNLYADVFNVLAFHFCGVGKVAFQLNLG